MGGKKREKIFFQKHTYIASYKRWKKIVWKKCENTFFYENTNIVTKKWGGKNASKIFSKNTRILRVLNDGKKPSGKSAKTRFFKHMNIVTKNGGKTREKIFPETHSIRKQTTMEKNRLEKVRKHVFYKHTNIVTKKWREKNARKKLSKNTRIGYPKIVRKKSSGKSVKISFL